MVEAQCCRFGSDADSIIDHGSKEICRICHSGVSETSLISPCRCSGSIQFSHPSCLLQWLTRSGKFKCELCGTRYNVILDGYKPLREWRMMRTECEEKLHLGCLACCFLVITITLVYWLGLAYSLIHFSPLFGDTSIRILMYTSYGPLNVVCVVFALLEIRLIVMPLFDRWRIRNVKIKVLPYTNKRVKSANKTRLTRRSKKTISRSASQLSNANQTRIANQSRAAVVTLRRSQSDNAIQPSGRDP